MGGCRCSFRDCTVSTSRNPNMHFFHFPLKDESRLQKWYNMAAAEHIKNKPLAYKKNRVVCARHFRDECFMNYKRDRLVQTAVPTLMRFSKYMACDYELEEPTIIILKKPTMSHLISPSNFKDPLEFDDDDDEEDESIDLDLVRENIVEDIEKCLTYKKRKIPETKDGVIGKKPKILNKNVNCQVDENLHHEFEEVVLRSGDQEENDDDEHIILKSTMSEGASPHFMFSKKDNDDTNIEYILETFKETDEHKEEDQILSPEAEIAELKEKINSLEEQLANAKRHQKQKHDKLKKMTRSKNSFQNALDFMRTERDALKEENELLHKQISAKSIENDKHDNNVQKNPMSQVSTTFDTNKESTTVCQVPTKSQLFKGIKKYLSASMVALVRMEMFGNSERNWKPDELRTAIDLLQLGENIYRYFTDEWRFRLPAINEVRNCLSAATPLDDDEEL